LLAVENQNLNLAKQKIVIDRLDRHHLGGFGGG